MFQILVEFWLSQNTTENDKNSFSNQVSKKKLVAWMMLDPLDNHMQQIVNNRIQVYMAHLYSHQIHIWLKLLAIEDTFSLTWLLDDTEHDKKDSLKIFTILLNTERPSLVSSLPSTGHLQSCRSLPVHTGSKYSGSFPLPLNVLQSLFVKNMSNSFNKITFWYRMVQTVQNRHAYSLACLRLKILFQFARRDQFCKRYQKDAWRCALEICKSAQYYSSSCAFLDFIFSFDC